MKIEEIAAKLMKLREGMSSFIQTGVLREELGFDGYSEALRQRWVEPDQEGSGMMTLSNNLAKVAEMKELAEGFCFQCKDKPCTCDGKKCKKGCKDGECKCEPEAAQCESLTEGAHLIAQSHAFRPKMSVQEIATMGLGNTPSAPAPAPAPAAPSSAAPPTRPASTKPEDVQIGSDVCVVEGGKSYMGKVAQVKADGRYVLSFGSEKPSVNRDYDKTEVRPIAVQ